MNKQQAENHYAEQSRQLTALIGRLKRRSRSLVAAQIATFVAMIGFVAAYTATSWGAWALLAALVMLLTYVAMRWLDGNNTDRTNRAEALLKVNQRELQYLSGDFSAFADGRQYACAEHPFSFDLDLFGRESLFQRINRTATTGGSDCLAAWLSHDYSEADAPGQEAQKATIGRIEERRKAIRRLTPLTDWRTRFVAIGIGGSVDTSRMAEALATVRQQAFPSWPKSVWTKLAAVASLLVFYGLIALAACSILPASIATAWGFLQLLGTLLLCQSHLKKMSQALDSLRSPMAAYVSIFRLMAEQRPESDTAEALEAFSEAKTLLDGLSRRNDIGILLFDTFALNDIFLLRRFLRWRDRFLHHIDAWMLEANRTDALVSMATFCYNEPSAVDPEIVEGNDVVYEARGLWHPFLGECAVRNDFVLQDGHYYIVTGANMAGKSTFLRALGVNFVLAMNGLPVFAEGLRVSVFSLFTNMRTTDDLTRGISYFNAELLRLKQLLAHVGRHRNTLIILDEILKGTNSADKLAGSRLFLEHIAHKRVTGIVATHDLELSRMADDGSGRFHNHCFEIGLDTRATYSYKITPGVARNRNATYLLQEILKMNTEE